MVSYISILRGINVGGQKIIKMTDLKKMYEKLNFEGVKTFIQSGNVVFSVNRANIRDLEKIISSQIEKDFGFSVPVIVLDVQSLQKIVNNNPFSNDNLKNAEFLHVTFLGDVPAEFDKGKIIEKMQPNEDVVFTVEAVYLYCPNGYAKTKLNNAFLEKKLKVLATTRNWNTVKELLALAE